MKALLFVDVKLTDSSVEALLLASEQKSTMCQEATRPDSEATQKTMNSLEVPPPFSVLGAVREQRVVANNFPVILKYRQTLLVQ